LLRLLTAGESHGKALVAVIEGLPAGVPLESERINAELARRQKGYGRGGRMDIEQDRAEILSGVRLGRTTGAPVALYIANRDYDNWREVMRVEPGDAVGSESGLLREPPAAVTRPRPGHADLAGALKYGHRDMRDVLERESARETASRCAAGAVARVLLERFEVRVYGRVLRIGAACAPPDQDPPELWAKRAEASPVRCADRRASEAMIAEIDRAREDGDTVGGVFEVVVDAPPPGLGSYVQWDRRLDARLAAAVMSVNGVKGVEVGLGFECASRRGSEVHDPILYDGRERRFVRPTNNAGGLEGGVTNGEPVVVRAAMKPIATTKKPLPSIDVRTREAVEAHFERSDVCAVPAASVVAEAVVAFELAGAFLEKFGGDSLEEIARSYESYLRALEEMQ